MKSSSKYRFLLIAAPNQTTSRLLKQRLRLLQSSAEEFFENIVMSATIIE